MLVSDREERFVSEYMMLVSDREERFVNMQREIEVQVCSYVFNVSTEVLHA
jgi:hypothetical protein